MADAEDEIKTLQSQLRIINTTIIRSGLDTTMCSYCGEMQLTLPDGGNLCAKCAEENK